jgi:isopentenyl-diphosphate delta-isomerase type 1
MEDIFAGLNTQIDIVDEKGNKTGETKSYDEVHASGLLHKSVHVWVLNSKGEILLQKRSKYVRAYPLYWDISAAGHVNSGQTSLEAAQMETKEELGLLLLSADFKFLCTLNEYNVSNNGKHIENGLSDIYVLHLDLEISQLKIEPEEVEEVRWVRNEEFEKWISGKVELLVPHTGEYEKILEYLK